MPFKDIFDQAKALTIITGQLASGRVPHAYLFLGQDGVGRKKTALELAKTLNCGQSTGVPRDNCGHCISCQKIERGLHPDVQIIDFAFQARLENKDLDKQRVIKIDTIRAVQRDISLKPTEGTWKIYCIDPAEKITLDAANCLLKTLEEPPAWTLIILLAKHKENLPATIVSRTQTVPFRPLAEKTIADYLIAQQAMDWTQALDIARLSEGSLGQALTLVTNRQSVQSSFWSRLKDTRLPAAEILEESQARAKNAAAFLDELLAEAKRDFREAPERYRLCVAALLQARAQLERNVNPQMILDVVLLDLNNAVRRNAHSL
jgi:DNA polymerase-3 subunit delta'